MEHGGHVIFYRRETTGIMVSRILHQGMMPERHEMEEDEES
jgi:plasmid stabilization system protein ParE